MSSRKLGPVWGIAAALSLVLFPDCSSSEAGPGEAAAPDGGQRDGSVAPGMKGTAVVAVPLDDPGVIRAARGLLAAGGMSSRVLAPRAGELERSSGALLSAGWRANFNALAHIGARLPEKASEEFLFSLGRDQYHALRLVALGANPESAAREYEGRVLYRDMFPSTDAIVATSPEIAEIFLLLRDASAPAEFSWSMPLPEALPGIEREPGGSLLLSNAYGQAMLRVAAPLAVDARGETRTPELAWNDGRLTLRLDTTGLSYPILLDPLAEPPLWIQRTPTNKPSGRYLHRMAYLASTQTVILYGGTSGTASSETWEWNGTNWALKTLATKPSARFGHSMSTRSTSEIALFGGSSGYSETWGYTSTGWTEKTPGTKPVGRTSAAMARTTPTSSTALLFGGIERPPPVDPELFDDTWQWSTYWNLQNPSTAPVGRIEHTMAETSLGVLLFGGNGTNETWRYSTNWTNLNPTTKPTARDNAAMAWDAVRSVAVLFGGEIGTTGKDDTWEWTGDNWKAITPVTKPSARYGHAMAFDAPRKQVVLFGGRNGSTYLGDTWVYQQLGIACTAASQCATGFCVDGVCCDAACSGACKTCGQADSTGRCKTITNAENPGECDGVNQCSASAVCLLKKGQSCSSPGACASGFCADGYCCDKACTAPCDACSFAKTFYSNGTCTNSYDGLTPSASCSGYACNGNQATCPTTCASVNDCVAGYFCGKDGKCQAAKPLAATCSAANDCIDGSACESRLCQGTLKCVDGVCCDGPCTAACDKCNTAGHCVVSPSTETCGNYLCSGSATTCPTSCQGDTQCAPGSACIGGVCAGKLGIGSTCQDDVDCLSNNCEDGYCCNTSCNGACDRCNLSGLEGTCNNAPEGSTGEPSACGGNLLCTGSSTCPTGCVGDAQCQLGFFCNAVGQCEAQQLKGESCDQAHCKQPGCRQCTTGICSDDNVCCDAPCDGSCDVCNKSGSLGTCVPASNTFTGSPDCGYFLCDGAKATCPDGCSSDANCDAGNYCSAQQTCVPRRSNGEACSQANECLSQKCVDGYCCNLDCTGACNACNVPSYEGTCTFMPLGAEGDPTCNGTVCTGASPDCPGSCKGDTDCSGGYYCDNNGKCTLRKQNLGAACNPTNECYQGTSCQLCASGYCTDGVCCNTECGAPCDRCNMSGTEGTCTLATSTMPGVPACESTLCSGTSELCPGSSCITDATCKAGYYCDSTGTCQPRKKTGASCDPAGDCKSPPCGVCENDQPCVDGFCCTTSCVGACNRCDLNPGICTTLSPGTPSTDCGFMLCNGLTDCPATCNSDSACAPEAFCSNNDKCVGRKNQGDTCGPDAAIACRQDGCRECGTSLSCADGVCCGSPCDGPCDTCKGTTPGTCTMIGAGKGDACGAYFCDGANPTCPTGCAKNADCTTGLCDNGVCAEKKSLGQACAIGYECESTFCADGVCCDKACSSQCEACNQGAAAGTCVLVSGPPASTKPACTGTGTCGGTCNGADTTCVYPTDAITCGSTCTNGVYRPKKCSGQGECVDQAPTACAPFACDAVGGKCKTSCLTSTDCDTSAECDSKTGTCVEKTSTCSDDFTAKASSGATTSCIPYRCKAGACVSDCTGAMDCYTGYDCVNSKCVAKPSGTGGSGGGGAGAGGESGAAGQSPAPPAPSVEQDTGCGCSVPGRQLPSPAAALIAIAGLAAARRRRR